jgi:hypothetical protein
METGKDEKPPVLWTLDELRRLLIQASGKLDSGTEFGTCGDEVHYWLSQALYYGIEDTIITWAKAIKQRKG